MYAKMIDNTIHPYPLGFSSQSVVPVSEKRMKKPSALLDTHLEKAAVCRDSLFALRCVAIPVPGISLWRCVRYGTY